MNSINKDKRIIYVCCGTGCLANGSKEIYESLKKKIEKLGEPIAVETYIKPTGCNGLCEKGPIVKIMPDDISYFKVQDSDIEEIIDKTIIKGEVIDRLLYFDISLRKKVKSHKESEFYKRQMKIALRNIGEIDPTNIHDYIERGGYKALRKAIFDIPKENKIGRAHV